MTASIDKMETFIDSIIGFLDARYPVQGHPEPKDALNGQRMPAMGTLEQ
jgi:hypothetical protein